MSSGEITRLLRRMADEDSEARKATYDEVVALTYLDLKRRASAALRGNESYTRPTSLVHELYGKLSSYRMHFNDRQHFLNSAAKEMRRLILQDARRRKANKRGGRQHHTTLNEESALLTYLEDPDLLIDIDRAVEELPTDQVKLIELYWYGGFTMEQTAEILSLTLDAAKYRWELIKRKLVRKLEHGYGPDA